MNIKKNSLLILCTALLLTFNACKKDEDQNQNPTPTPAECNDDAHIGFTSLATDACGEGANSALLDGTRLEFKYDAINDSIWFLLTVNSVSSSQAIGVNVMVNIPNGGPVFNFWGTENTDAYHKLLTFWVTGNAPSSYSGTIGIADSSGVDGNDFTNLFQNNITCNVNTSDKTILLGINRADLIPNTNFIGNTITVKIAAAVGSDQAWNDDIYNAASTMTITKNSVNITLATVTTDSASAVTSNSATSGGNVTNDGGATVTERGIAIATHPNPGIADLIITGGSGTGSFVSNMTGLSANTVCYVRAYATNSIGTAYGNEVVFTTLVNIPTVTTEPATAVTATSATSGGTVTDDGGAPVTERGIAIATHAIPTTADFTISSGNGVGSFVSNMTGLSASTICYVRAYAINSAGTAYGNQVVFTTDDLVQLMQMDSIRILDPGAGNTLALPDGKKINVVVTSNYATGMFASGRNMYAQDASAGIMIRFLANHTFAQGNQLEIDISGMELSTFNGVLQINNVPLANATVLGTASVTPITVASIADITPSYDSWEGRLVKLTGVTITGSGVYGGTNLISDFSGSIDLFTASTATFAATAYPTGTVSITGILTEFNGVKEIIIRDVSDVQ